MRPILTLGVILTICSVAGAQTANLVQAELVAETKAVQAGHPFRVGLHLTIADGWHVYWINPGDAGAATTFKLTIPDGFTVGPVQYPVPENLPQPGGLTVYAYEHELLLTATVTPPTDLNGASSIPISAAAGWCVCTPEKCVLGKAKLSLDLAVGTGRSQPDNSDLFTAWQPRFPVSSDSSISSTDWEMARSARPGSALRATVGFTWRNDPPAGNLVWLPGPSEDLIVKAGDVQTIGRVSKLSLKVLPIQGISPTSSTFGGVLAYYVAGKPAAGVVVSIDRQKLGLPVP